ncbi:MAG: prepilin-type N-terminal cleavage/methylation domain-containing protein [Gammaproteobacteria bacterium]|nr:prepilin-type N-terminal cleavage/methylation domain-containing protein [Gammaproteobacteria bacterium]
MPRPSSNHGYTLLEVLIALSIISITLLGFAEAEVYALKTEKNFSNLIKT